MKKLQNIKTALLLLAMLLPLISKAQFLPCPGNSWSRTIYRNEANYPLKPADTYTQAAQGFMNDVNIICVLKFEYMYPGAGQWFTKTWLGGLTEAVDPAPIYAMGKDKITFKYRRSRLLTAIPFPVYKIVYDYVTVMLSGPRDINVLLPQNTLCRSSAPVNMKNFTKFTGHNMGATPEWAENLRFNDHNQVEIPDGIINPSALAAGQYTWKVSYEDNRISHGNKTVSKYITFNVVDLPSLAFNTLPPDTVWSNAQPINLGAMLTYSQGAVITSPSVGVTVSGQGIFFNPANAGTGPKLITLKATNSSGCDTTIFRPIFVKYNPGTPYMPLLSDESTIRFISQNRIEQYILSTMYQLQCGTAIGCVPAITNYTQMKIYSQSLGFPTFMALYYDYYINMQGYLNSTYVCDGKNYVLKVADPQTNMANPLDNLTYHWYKENSLGVQELLGSGTTYGLQVADNDSDDVFTIYLSAKNYIGVESPKYPMRVYTNHKYRSQWAGDTLCHDNSYAIDIPVWSDYQQYAPFSDTGAVGQDLVLWNNFFSRSVKAYNGSGNLIASSDSNRIDIPLSPVASQKVGLLFGSRYPYYLFYDDYNYSTGTLTTPPQGLTGTPSPWKPVTGIPFHDLGCECESTDTVLFAKKPVLTFNINSDTVSYAGSLINIQNQGEFGGESFWNFLDGGISYLPSPFHYLYDPGCQDIYYVETNTYGCESDTTVFCYTFVPEAYLSADEETALTGEPELYPVPFTDELTLETPLEIREIEIYDPSGKLVYRASGFFTGQHGMNLFSLSPGIYYVRLTAGNGMLYNRKITKQ